MSSTLQWKRKFSLSEQLVRVSKVTRASLPTAARKMKWRFGRKSRFEPQACYSNPKALAKRNASHRKSTQVLLLALTCIPFGHPLAFTCEDLRLLWTCSNLGRKSAQLASRLATQRKWMQVFASHSNFFGNLLANLMPLFEQESQTISLFPFWQDGFCHGAKFGKLKPRRAKRKQG